MKVFWILSPITLVILTGCGSCPEPRRDIIHTPCPKFTYKTSVEFLDYNNTYALISKKDVNKIVTMSKKKQVFNDTINKMNKKSQKNITER